MEIEEDSVIGRGTWLDRVASEIVDREKKLGRDISIIRVESGLGASGIPHIGNLSDAARAYGVKLALEEFGFKSELIAYSDDMDALRKVPAGLPQWLQSEIAKPVSEIKDPFDCHPSYGAHMSALLIEGMSSIGLTYTFQSGYEAYKKGLLVKQIDLILKNAEVVGDKIEELTGQKKYQGALPYFPQCSKCLRLNVAKAYKYDPVEMRVYYKCTGDEIGKKWIDGCGNEGYVDIRKGDGKLLWKVEFAARWAAFDIRYEAHGKELTDSVKVSDWVSENILEYPPPYHVIYELFQDKTGKKISKSVGNLVSAQKWLTVATPQSLLLVYFKRIVGARNISEEDVPKYMDELDLLEDLYFGKVKEENKMKEARLKGLYFYSWLARPPTTISEHVPYGMLVELAQVAPKENAEEYISKKVVEYRAAKIVDERLRNRIRLAIEWAKEFSLSNEPVALNPKEKEAMIDFASRIENLRDENEIQGAAFEVARSHEMEPKSLFRLLYLSLLGAERGPRLGPYIRDLGPDRVSSRLREVSVS